MTLGLEKRASKSAPEDLLLSFAAGDLDSDLGLVVDTQVYYNAQARERVRDYEALGGILMEEAAPEKLHDDALSQIFARIDEEGDSLLSERETAQMDQPRDGLDLPPHLRRLVGQDITALKWSGAMKGVRELRLPNEGERRLRLLEIQPGVKVVDHTHQGREWTLVLQGAYEDGSDVFAKGDLQIADEEINHAPKAIGSDVCLCLVMTEAPIRLTGPFGRLLNPFIRF